MTYLSAPLADEAGGLPLGVVLLLIAVVVAGVTAAAALGRLHRLMRDPQMRVWLRVRWRRHPGPGFATRWDMWRRYGLPRARRDARHKRPSLRRADLYGPGTWRRYATFLGWGPGWVHRWRIYAKPSDITITIAPPQKGKSSIAAGRILDAPGPVVATSIRGDLIANTAALRGLRGELHVFNPEGVGEYGSTFRWNPVLGCHDMDTAIRRAGHMVEAVAHGGLSDATFWNDQAVQVLSSLMHAAGLVEGGTLAAVYGWLTNDAPAPVEILTRMPYADPQAAQTIARFRALPDKTRQSVELTCRNVLRFMTSAEIAAAVMPQPGDREFVIGDFLRSEADTLYLVASAEAGSPVPPLLAALVAEIKHEAVRLGSRSPAGLLDPPLSMELDEVANVTPIPLPTWASYAAGSGIRLSIYTQAWGQIVERWGVNGADALWQTATCKVIVSGCSERELLTRITALCGRTKIVVRDSGYTDREGRPRPVREMVDVMPPDQVRRLPDGHALVLMDNARPVIVRLERVWKRADVKRAQRLGMRPELPPRGGRPRLPVAAPRRAGLDWYSADVDQLDRAPQQVEQRRPYPAAPYGHMPEAPAPQRAPQPQQPAPHDELAERRARRRRPYETQPQQPAARADLDGQAPPPEQDVEQPPAAGGERPRGSWSLNDLL
ncbi:type IV secretory system conjugative DNA transfer family protein [Microbispora sp. CA-102843]|uniref:type IV secretory system conjugative DNA transfer family protein n=1 Tax=Microbispora sp. CA-102843 TaxID=3239952 RepID=UPI003D8BCBBB